MPAVIPPQRTPPEQFNGWGTNGFHPQEPPPHPQYPPPHHPQQQHPEGLYQHHEPLPVRAPQGTTIR
jgi:hypothetical protein